MTASGTATMAKFHDEAKQQLRQIESWRRRPDEATLYASLIPGNRLVAVEKWDEAKAAYERVASDHPNDPQIRYRLAVLDFERRDYASAARALEQLSASSGRMPDWLRATTLLYLAWTHDLAGLCRHGLELDEELRRGKLEVLDPHHSRSHGFRQHPLHIRGKMVGVDFLDQGLQEPEAVAILSELR